MNETDVIVRSILEHYPTAQAIYLFGTYGTADEWPDSDVDIAVLFSPQQAKKAGLLAMSDLRFELEALLKKRGGLVHLRRVPTVLQKRSHCRRSPSLLCRRIRRRRI